MATPMPKGLGCFRVFRPTAGLILMGLGVLTVSYSVWAYTESRAYLDEVETSGQAVEAFDAANYLMTSSGLYLLVGALLAALGGLYLTRPTGSPVKDSPGDRQDNPATSETPPSSTHARQAPGQGSVPSEEEELDELLRGIDDKA